MTAISLCVLQYLAIESQFGVDKTYENPFGLLIVEQAESILEFLVDFYVAFTFLTSFLFFLELKRNKLYSRGLKLTRFNRFIIAVVMTLIAFNCFNSFVRCLLTPMIEDKFIADNK